MGKPGDKKLEVCKYFLLTNFLRNNPLQVVRVRPGNVEMSQLGFLADYLQSRLWCAVTPAPKRRLNFKQQENCLIFR